MNNQGSETTGAAGGTPLAEAEVKLRLSPGQFEQMPRSLEERGFCFAEDERVTDYYVEFAESPVRGFDFTRLRCINDAAFVRTEKRWQLDERGNPVRVEREQPLTESEFRSIARGVPANLILQKHRTNFRGKIQSLPVVVSLDAVRLKGATFHFIEAEAMVPVSHAHEARLLLLQWLRDDVGLSEAPPGASMLRLLLWASGELELDV